MPTLRNREAWGNPMCGGAKNENLKMGQPPYFNNAVTDFTEGSNAPASDIFAAVDIRLNPNRPTVGAQTEQGSGTQGPIFVNPNGPFFIPMPGTPTYSIGPYQAGTPQAQVTILFHEFAHKIDAVPADSGNVPLSMANTNTVLGNCQQQVNQIAH